MSDAENPIPPMPDAKIFLEGKDGIKPLQHKADALTQFAAGFEEVPLAPTASEKLVQLGEVMKKPHWAGAHDAANNAMSAARKLVTENPSEELAKLSFMVESVGNARAPHVDTVKGIKHPVLEKALKPLVTYLEEFGSFITGWAGLLPSRMRTEEGQQAITLALHRANMSPPDNTVHVHGPGCNHHHELIIPPVNPEASPTDGHVHGRGCGHDHAPSSSSGGGTHEPHLPKGKSNAGWWVAGIVAAVGVGAYLINEFGKPDKKKEDAPKPKDWKARVESSTSSEARTL